MVTNNFQSKSEQVDNLVAFSKMLSGAEMFLWTWATNPASGFLGLIEREIRPECGMLDTQLHIHIQILRQKHLNASIDRWNYLISNDWSNLLYVLNFAIQVLRYMDLVFNSICLFLIIRLILNNEMTINYS